MKPATRRTAFRIQLGDAIASSTAGESTRQLLQLQVDLDMDGPVAHCIIELAEGTPPATGDGSPRIRRSTGPFASAFWICTAPSPGGATMPGWRRLKVRWRSCC